MTFPAHVYAVILAGGSGTRFWPKSRHLRPKQLCPIGPTEKTMLEVTLDRLDGLIPPERRFIVTHKDQAESTKTIAGRAAARVIAEPDARNTAHALALAALEIAQAAPAGSKPVMVSVHADAIIKKPDVFHARVRDAVAIAEDGYLTLMGIVPAYAETGYGYIERGPALAGEGSQGPKGFKVASFREKPQLAIAQDYVASGRFYWNSGIFVWRTDVLLSELNTYLPGPVQHLGDFLRSQGKTSYTQVDPSAFAKVYAALPKISIDNAVLEVSQKVAVVPADIDWQDVGSWDALKRTFGADNLGNVAFGPTLAIDSRNVTIDSDGPLVAALGVENLVIVSSGNAVLVCPTERAQDVKLIVEALKSQGRSDLI